MLEIKSQWVNWTDEQGNCHPSLHLFLTRNQESFNCAMVMNKIDDGDDVLLCLESMITELVAHAYPEMRDPLYKLKKQLQELETKTKGIKMHIEEMEKVRAEGREHEMYEEENHCEYESCKVRWVEHYHIDEHTLTFRKPENELA